MILSIHQTRDLELSSSLCQAFIFTLLSQNWKPTSSLLHTDLSFFSHATNPPPAMHVFGVCVCCVWACMRMSVYVHVCAQVCDEMSVSISLCKCSGLLWDGDAINNRLLLLHEQEHETSYQRQWQQYTKRGTYHRPTQLWWWIAEGTADNCTPEYNKKSWTSKISPDCA